MPALAKHADARGGWKIPNVWPPRRPPQSVMILSYRIAPLTAAQIAGHSKGESGPRATKFARPRFLCREDGLRSALRRLSRPPEFALGEESLPQGKPDQLDIRADPELALDEVAEVGNRLRAEMQGLGDFLRGPFGQHHGEDCEFARRQHVGGDRLVGEAAERELMVDVRTECDPPVEDVEDSLYERLRWARLGDVASCPGAHCLHGKRCILMHGE